MKKIIAMILFIICVLQLTSCGNKAKEIPKMEACENADQLVEMLSTKYCGEESQLQEISTNPNLCQFFQKDYPDRDMLIQKFFEADFSAQSLLKIYNACNEDSWYCYLMYGKEPLYLTAYKPTTSQLVDSIDYRFKDPQSVSVSNVEFFWQPPSENSNLIESDFMVVADVRATNSFGGYVVERYVIEAVPTPSSYKKWKFWFVGPKSSVSLLGYDHVGIK